MTEGVGARYLTSRNQQTLPANIPQFRHAPLTERFLKATTSTKLIQDDDRSLRRNADQIVKLTSGDYGKYLIDTESSVVRLNMKASRPMEHFSLDPSPNLYRTVDPKATMPLNEFDKSFRIDKDPILLEKKNQETARSTARQTTGRTEESARGENKYISTLNNLDGAFNKFSRRDLLAASLPLRAEQELRWCAISNHRCAQQSESWGRSLRKERVIGSPSAGGAISGEERS